jgi:hypothetical protein
MTPIDVCAATVGHIQGLWIDIAGEPISHEEESQMQFAMLIYHGTMPLPNTEAWEALPADERKAILAGYATINKNPAVTPGVGLGPKTTAKTVRVQNGTTSTTEGPFAGVDGAVGGYLVFEADDEAAALELAASIPAARFGGAVEVRPVVSY